MVYIPIPPVSARSGPCICRIHYAPFIYIYIYIYIYIHTYIHIANVWLADGGEGIASWAKRKVQARIIYANAKTSTRNRNHSPFSGVGDGRERFPVKVSFSLLRN